MRRITIALTIAGALAAPAAFGHDVPDGKDCRDNPQATAKTFANGASEADRFAVCINQGGMTLLYVGGEGQSEDPRNDGFAGTCGAIIVANQHVASGNQGEDWTNNGPDGRPGTSDDYHC